MAALSGLALWLRGMGRVSPPDAGATANPPAPPPVQYGSYEYIQSFAFQGAGHAISDVPVTPPAWQDWGQFGVPVFDPSGLTGGGYSQSPDVAVPGEVNLYYDTSTGLYYNLGNGA